VEGEGNPLSSGSNLDAMGTSRSRSPMKSSNVHANHILFDWSLGLLTIEVSQ
jgi:hypothetical protein